MAHWVPTDKEATLFEALVNKLETMAADSKVSENGTALGRRGKAAVAPPARQSPTSAQRAYLVRGLDQPGGKLPLFDRQGREIARKTVESCLSHGWAEPWFENPTKPDWLVCRLTEAGYAVLGAAPPGAKGGGEG